VRLLQRAGLEVVSCDVDDASGRGHLVVLAVKRRPDCRRSDKGP